jgi:Tat protein secretion system quality control protein TatD with DNase activity
MASSAEEFPWHLGLHDAHCHPLDRPISFSNISTMKTQSLGVMATRLQDQSILDKYTKEHGPEGSNFTHETKIVPGFGWHPWFSQLLYNDTDNPLLEDQPAIDDEDKRAEHFTAVLTPSPGRSFALALELPTPLSHALTQLREHLTAHPLAMVGEVGLDKAFRLPEPWGEGEEAAQRERDPDRTPGARCRRKLSAYRVSMEHQKTVLNAQLRIAGEMGRAVSVHGVQAHGVLYEVFRELWKGHEVSKRKAKKNKEAWHPDDEPVVKKKTSLPFPPRICLHSYSGPVDSLKPYFAPAVPSAIYVSFAWMNNFSSLESASQRAIDVIRWAPATALLVESDLHAAGEDADELLKKMARMVCEVRGWGLEDGVKQLGRNWWRFVTGSEEGWENDDERGKAKSGNSDSRDE